MSPVGHEDSTYLYSQFIHDQKIYAKVRVLIDKAYYNDALTALKSIQCLSFNCRPKYIYQGKAYTGLGNINMARRYIRKAVELGYDPSFLNQPLFSEVFDSTDFAVEWKLYLSKMDDGLRMELHQMILTDQHSRHLYLEARKKRVSDEYLKKHWEKMLRTDLLHRERLYQIVDNCKGWPSIKYRGIHTNSPSQSPIDPTILVLHMPELDNIYFLRRVVNKCEIGEEFYFSAVSIMSNLLRRFPVDSSGINNLVYFDHNESSNVFRIQMDVLADICIEKGSNTIQFYEIESSEYVRNYSAIQEALANRNVSSRLMGCFSDISCSDVAILPTNSAYLFKIVD